MAEVDRSRDTIAYQRWPLPRESDCLVAYHLNGVGIQRIRKSLPACSLDRRFP